MQSNIVFKHFPGLVAMVSGLLLLPWILGVPGKPSPLTHWAWMTGLMTIVSYLVIFQSVRSMQARAKFTSPSVQRGLDRALLLSACLAMPILSGALLTLICG